MFLSKVRERPQPSLLDALLAVQPRFSIQAIEALRSGPALRFEWFYRPGLRGLSTQQVFDRLGDDPRAWELEERIIEAGLGWADRCGRPVSLNVSPGAISQPGFRHRLRELLGPWPAEHWWEVTESWPPADPLEGRRTLDLLREHRQPIAYDDATSLERLEQWVATLGEPDIVKVDQTVVQRRPEELAPLVAAIHALGAQAVVEGVETHAAYERARQSGADFWQGYYLATPQYVLDDADE